MIIYEPASLSHVADQDLEVVISDSVIAGMVFPNDWIIYKPDVSDDNYVMTDEVARPTRVRKWGKVR